MVGVAFEVYSRAVCVGESEGEGSDNDALISKR